MKKNFIMGIIFFLFLNAHAVDNLFLTGEVKKYEPDTGKIVVDVKSSSCRGLKTFFTEKGLSADKLTGKEIYFRIDSNTCEKGKIYRIMTSLK